MQNTYLSRLHTRSQALFNEIILYAIFIRLWMHFENFYRVNLFWSSMAMTNIYQKSICIYQDCRNKGFMFTVKEVWDRVCSPENQFFNISSCKWPNTSSLKSFTWFWRGIEELLPIYFFIPSTCPTHDVTNFIDFDWFRHFFGHWNYSSLNRYNSGTRTDIKKR